MAKYACAMQNIFSDVKTQLKPSLGDSLDALDIRIGFHSGKVTAGVLRSEKGRFQLFGDTVNVAARYEQNGIPGKIQVSEIVMNELVNNGCENWLVERLGGIIAKGVGHLKAYWIITERVTGHGVIEVAPKRGKIHEEDMDE